MVDILCWWNDSSWVFVLRVRPFGQIRTPYYLIFQFAMHRSHRVANVNLSISDRLTWPSVAKVDLDWATFLLGRRTLRRFIVGFWKFGSFSAIVLLWVVSVGVFIYDEYLAVMARELWLRGLKWQIKLGLPHLNELDALGEGGLPILITKLEEFLVEFRNP